MEITEEQGEEKGEIHFLFLGNESVAAALDAIKGACLGDRKSVTANNCVDGPALAVKLKEEEKKLISLLGFNLKPMDLAKDDPQGLFSLVLSRGEISPNKEQS